MDFTIWKYENGYQTDVIPIVYLHSFRGNGEDVWKACHPSAATARTSGRPATG